MDVVGSASPIQETTGKPDDEIIQHYYRQLGCAKFTAVMHGRRVTVDLVQDKGERCVVHRALSLEVETYLSGSGITKKISTNGLFLGNPFGYFKLT